MLERTTLTWLPSRSRIPTAADDQVWITARAQLYCDLDTRLTPPVAVSVFESVLFKLYKMGLYSDLADVPSAWCGAFAEADLVHSKNSGDLIIEDDSACVAVSLEYLNPIGEVIFRERVEAVEKKPLFRCQEYESFFSSGDEEGSLDLQMPTMPAQDCRDRQVGWSRRNQGQQNQNGVWHFLR